jgi:hypothetical protein
MPVKREVVNIERVVLHTFRDTHGQTILGDYFNVPEPNPIPYQMNQFHLVRV